MRLMIQTLLFLIPILIDSTIVLPGIFNFDTPTVQRLVCSSNTTLSLNLVCYNEARLLIVTAKSGSQARDICLFPQDFEVPLNGSCHEEINTSIFVKERSV